MAPRDAFLVGLAVLLPIVPLAVTWLTTDPPGPENGPADVPPGQIALEVRGELEPHVGFDAFPQGARGVSPGGRNRVGESPKELGGDDLLSAKGLTLGTLERDLARTAASLEEDPEVRRHWELLVATLGLQDSPDAYAEFSRVRLVHEAFRSGGWAGLHLASPEPESEASSTRIWRAWVQESAVDVEASSAELSALFAFVARGMGVEHVGLYTPGSEHTVAGWSTPGQDGQPVVVVVPTSQRLLDPVAGLGDNRLAPTPGTVLTDYDGQDLPPGTLLPELVSRRIMEGVRRHGGDSSEELVLMRLRGAWFQR